MKLALLSLLLLISIDARQDAPAPTAEDQGQPKALEIERGFVSAHEGWYQDLYGLVRESGAARTEILDWTVGNDGVETVLVGIGSRKESGIRLMLRFRYEEQRIVECTATGEWRRDVGSKPSDFRGPFRDVSGFVRVYSGGGSERTHFSCLFAVRGQIGQRHDPDDSPELVMGGFEVDRPFGEPAAGK